MKGKNILLVGATSTIAQALAHQLAQEGSVLHLMARDKFEVERIATDLEIRYQTYTDWSVLDIVNYDSHNDIVTKAIDKLGGLDGVIVSVGELGDQQLAQQDFANAQRIIDSNYTGVVSLLTPIANYLEQQKNGFIVGISSVAGDRGRQSNYIYGSAKGALSLFLQGLRNRLCKSNVHVMTVKPGFVDTKMTFGKEGMFLVASPEKVASDIIRGVKKRKNILYTPWFWWGIMTIIRSIPENIFKKAKL